MALKILSGRRLSPPRIVLYGVDGIGKTTFASCAPKPVFIFTEPGQGLLDVVSIERPTLDTAPWDGAPASNVMASFAEVLHCVGQLYTEPHDFQTVVIDTIDALEPMLWAHASKKHGKPNIEAFGYGKGYLFAVEEANTLLEGLDALTRERGMSVILLAHAQVKRYDAPDHEPFDRYQVRLQEKLAARIAYWADAVLFTNYRTHVVRDADRFDKQGTARGVGAGERMLYTEERPAFHAKNRYRLPPEMPFAWAALQDAIAASIQAGTVEAQPIEPVSSQPESVTAPDGAQQAQSAQA